MSKLIIFFLFAFMSVLHVNQMKADNVTTHATNCTYDKGGHGSCKGQLTTVYLTSTQSTVTFTAPSEPVLSISGPQFSTRWSQTGDQITAWIGYEFYIDYEWMEVIVNGGYYHVKIVYVK